MEQQDDIRLAGRVRTVARRYCRARLGRWGGDFSAADELADRITRAVLREHRMELAGPGPLAAVVYPHLAAAVDAAVTSHPAEQEQMADELERLPYRAREVLVLRALVGLTAEQVAAALGLTVDAVAQEQRHALALVREHR